MNPILRETWPGKLNAAYRHSLNPAAGVNRVGWADDGHKANDPGDEQQEGKSAQIVHGTRPSFDPGIPVPGVPGVEGWVARGVAVNEL
jgi:hypothetical protein